MPCNPELPFLISSTFDTYLDLWFAILGDNNKIDRIVTKAPLDDVFLLGQETSDLISVRGGELTFLVCGDKLLVKTVYRISRRFGVNGKIRWWRRIYRALDA